MAQSRASQQGSLLIAIWLNVFFFGLVSQQFYAYWVSGFKDPIRLRFFVTVQFLLVAFQSVLMWRVAYDVFALFTNPHRSSRAPPQLWEGPANSLCQVAIILSANVFLASRIHSLTNSRVQSGVVIALSTVAFALGIYTTVTTWLTPGASTGTAQRAISIIWHAVQALVECLITFFLSRVLLKSRSGIRRSDLIVNHLVRGAIQTGCLATLWAIASSITWFFLPHVMAFRIFDITSGTVYTQAIFDTLLSRIRMRQRMNHPTTHLELGSQVWRLFPAPHCVPCTEIDGSATGTHRTDREYHQNSPGGSVARLPVREFSLPLHRLLVRPNLES
ncbi:hypothetical protein BC826DRAFT_1186574 [Russula brevipes]|nr:hypothetical protein BC826DRAFT_1186574 [Russula brevipes]